MAVSGATNFQAITGQSASGAIAESGCPRSHCRVLLHLVLLQGLSAFSVVAGPGCLQRRCRAGLPLHANVQKWCSALRRLEGSLQFKTRFKPEDAIYLPQHSQSRNITVGWYSISSTCVPKRNILGVVELQPHHPSTDMDILRTCTILLLLALQTQGHPTSPTSMDGSSTDGIGWSKEAIIGLVAVLIAILSLALASGRCRRWVTSSLGCELSCQGTNS